MFICLLVLATSGCGGDKRELVRVEGRVTYQGNPVDGASIRFSPKFASAGIKQRAAATFTDSDGRYRINAYVSSVGVPPGEYSVTVVQMLEILESNSAPVHSVPAKYAYAESSGLQANIPEDHRGVLNLDFALE